jgi:hypothetical protein
MKKLLTLLLAAFVFTACNDAKKNDGEASKNEDLKPTVIGSAYMEDRSVSPYHWG